MKDMRCYFCSLQSNTAPNRNLSQLTTEKYQNVPTATASPIIISSMIDRQTDRQTDGRTDDGTII